jgi:hypothetical protein
MDKTALLEKYYLHDFYGFIIKTSQETGEAQSRLKNTEYCITYTEISLLCALEQLSDTKVRDFILGAATAFHLDESVVQLITNYQPLPQDSAIERLKILSAKLTSIIKEINLKDRTAINIKREIVFRSLQAARADGEISDSEIQRIEAMGEVLNVSKDEIATIIDIIKDNYKIRKRRAQLVFAEVADKLQ